MEHNLLPIGIPSGVLLIFAVFQIRYWLESKKSKEKIREILEADIFNKPSHSTNWEIRISHLDRLLESPLENLRRLSNATLVTGIAGTMGIFLSKVALIKWYDFDQTSIPPEIIIGVLIALLSSLLGLVFHLLILKDLGRSQMWISEKEDELFLKLTQTQPATPSIPEDLEKSGIKFLEGALNFLQEQRVTTSKIDEFLIAQKEIDQKMSDYMGSLTKQTDIGGKTQQDLETAVLEMKDYQTNMLQKTKELFDDLSKSSIEIKTNVHQLTKELQALPEAITQTLDMSDKFEIQAGSHIKTLHQKFIDHKNFLTQEIIQNQNDVKRMQSANLHNALNKAIEAIKAPIEQQIVAPLEKVSKQLYNTSKEMSEVSRQFNTDFKQSLKEMPVVAKTFSSNIKGSADIFSDISNDLQQSTSHLHEIVDSSTDRAWKPLLNDMNDFMDTVGETHERLAQVVQDLVQLISDLLEDISKKK